MRHASDAGCFECGMLQVRDGPISIGASKAGFREAFQGCATQVPEKGEFMV